MILLPFIFFLPAFLPSSPSSTFLSSSSSSKNNPSNADLPLFAIPGKTSALKNATNLPLPIQQTESYYQSQLSHAKPPNGKLSESEIYNLLTESKSAFLSLNYPLCVKNFDLLVESNPAMYLPLYGLSLFFESEYDRARAVLKRQEEIVKVKFGGLGGLPCSEEVILYNYIRLNEGGGEEMLVMEEKDARPLFQLVYGCLTDYAERNHLPYLQKLRKIYTLTTSVKSSDDKTLSYFYLALITSLNKRHRFEEYIQRGHEIESPGINGVLCLALAVKLDIFDDFVEGGELGELESVEDFMFKEIEGMGYEDLKKALGLKGTGRGYGKKEEIVEQLFGMLMRE
ncbi:hypothetical protein TrLO_g10539 [Triparma laevis f. longispina]|uniref:Uncharacterized protein n=1 Tax=Triparma laevis f. longispina TaxID=1714387 RepID=A0A9W7FTG4_9STRA|nr:hypothetical protein TrLO_g10539 [Triparma laevis f. longispina]